MKWYQKPSLAGVRGTLLLACAMFAVASGTMRAQCTQPNTAFQGGEVLEYSLYFNWKFVWMKAGSARLSTYDAHWEGQSAYKSELITHTNKKLDHYFQMRDTLHSTISRDMRPLYYKKAANEGGKYYVDQVWYKYAPSGKVSIRQRYLSRKGTTSDTAYSSSDCIYDMMSIFLRARNFDASKFKKGQVIPMPISDAKHLTNSWLIYKGKETFKVEGTNEKFRCLVFSFMEREDGKDHELIRFFVTDDMNHIPVRLDMFLSFGSAKAFLKGYRGVRSPLKSRLN